MTKIEMAPTFLTLMTTIIYFYLFFFYINTLFYPQHLHLVSSPTSYTNFYPVLQPVSSFLKILLASGTRTGLDVSVYFGQYKAIKVIIGWALAGGPRYQQMLRALQFISGLVCFLITGLKKLPGEIKYFQATDWSYNFVGLYQF